LTTPQRNLSIRGWWPHWGDRLRAQPVRSGSDARPGVRPSAPGHFSSMLLFGSAVSSARFAGIGRRLRTCPSAAIRVRYDQYDVGPQWGCRFRIVCPSAPCAGGRRRRFGPGLVRLSASKGSPPGKFQFPFFREPVLRTRQNPCRGKCRTGRLPIRSWRRARPRDGGGFL